MLAVKRLIKGTLARLGWELHRAPAYGRDLSRDVRRILQPREVEVVLDVGANTGQTAALFLREFPRATIHSFEPNPAAYAQLAETMAKHRRAVLYQIALGARSGRAEMHLTQSSLTSSLLAISHDAAALLGRGGTPAGRVEVEVRALDDFSQTHGLRQIDLLKLDVQGFEVELLNGARQMLCERRIALVMTEVNFVKLYEGQAFFEDVYARLKQDGFRLVGLYRPDYRAGPYIAWCDALFVNLEAVQRQAERASPV